MSMPKPALWLGIAGLIPFVVGAIAVWTLDPGQGVKVMQAQMLYAAIILSFLGGLHWGRFLAGGVPDRWLYWSVTPSVLAWAAMILPIFYALLALILLLAACLFVDLKAFRQGLWPHWMKPLRKGLSMVAILSLAASLFRILIEGLA